MKTQVDNGEKIIKLFKILLVEDEDKIRQLLEEVLTHANYEVVSAQNGEQALDIFYQENFDLVILDWMMPNLGGLEVAKQIKKELPIKIIMLTAKNMPDDEVQALLSGVDDYLVKPFHAKLLLTRVSKVLGTLINQGNQRILFYPESQRVILDDRELALTKKEYDLLYYLYRNRDLALTREQLLLSVWGMNNENDVRTVDSFVRMLREKLGKEWIKTIYGVGYRFEIQKE